MTLRDHAFTVTRGTVEGRKVDGARRLVSGSNIRWEISVSPESNGDITVVLPITTDCTADGAICTPSPWMAAPNGICTDLPSKNIQGWSRWSQSGNMGRNTGDDARSVRDEIGPSMPDLVRELHPGRKAEARFIRAGRMSGDTDCRSFSVSLETARWRDLDSGESGDIVSLLVPPGGGRQGHSTAGSVVDCDRQGMPEASALTNATQYQLRIEG